MEKTAGFNLDLLQKYVYLRQGRVKMQSLAVFLFGYAVNEAALFSGLF